MSDSDGSSNSNGSSTRYVIGPSWCGWTQKQWHEVPESANTVHIKCDMSASTEFKQRHAAAFQVCSTAKGFPVSYVTGNGNGGSAVDANGLSGGPCAVGYVDAAHMNVQCPVLR